MLLFILLTLDQALAHPVTFKGGLAVTSIHRPKMTMSQVNYTVHRNVAVATSYVRMTNPTGDLNMPSLHANILLKRWNAIGSQGNLYGLVGAGVNTTSLSTQGSGRDDWTNEVRGFVGLQTDYETQKIYTAANVIGFPSVNDMSDTPYMARYRFGIAPYIAKYDEFQIWVVGQVEYMPTMQETPIVTPMLRYFYRTVLWETGVSLDGTYWFQMMAHF